MLTTAAIVTDVRPPQRLPPAFAPRRTVAPSSDPPPMPTEARPTTDAPFRVKVCGITSTDDARLVAEAGADAVGLNFVPGSPRCVDVTRAVEITAALPPSVLKVGVFAGMPAARVADLADAVGLDAIQFHGHLAPACCGAPPWPWDPPNVCAALAPRLVVRAARLRAEGPAAAALDEARGWIRAAAAAGRAPAMLLVDAGAPAGAPAGALGGTGKVVDWRRLVDAGPIGLPLALAGGLTPGNVAAAIRATGAAAVDTASGVESSPGRKDRSLVECFVREALEAFARRTAAPPTAAG